MPLIGIAPCARPHDYEHAVRRAGGRVRVLNPLGDDPRSVVDDLDGFLLPGGADLLPSIYGQTVSPSYVPAEPGRDEYELALARAAWNGDVPLLGICRGLQVLAVARGGALVQHIPDQFGTHVDHAPPGQSVALAHDVRVESGTQLEALLSGCLQNRVCAVNSRHHQAPLASAEQLVVSATAPDGVIEGMEGPGRRFYLGVGWHPENFYRTGEFDTLFRGLIEASRRR